MNLIHLSVVIPAYNEEQRIAPTVRAIAAYLSLQGYSSEIVVVLNNCTDGTKGVVQALEKEVPTLRHLDLGMAYHPAGTKGLAVEAGMLDAKGAYRIYLDADNAAEMGEIEKLWPLALGGTAVVFGSRYVPGSHIHVSWHRRVLSRMANGLIQAVLLPGVHDTQCAFKLFTAEAAEEIFSRSHTRGWGFDLEVLFLARYLGFKMQEVPIDWSEMGGSSVKPMAFMTAFDDLLTIRFNAWRGKYAKRK